MSNPFPLNNASNTGAVFAQLNQQDIEEFYTGYQLWNLQHQFEVLQTRLEDLRKQIDVNTARMQEVHPTALELATLARLQSNGVSDIDLLDRMLEQGELWLDRTMQRLDYLEQLDDFIRDDYTQWCQHALEGAYDWIDSVLDGNPTSLPLAAATEEEGLTEATEELFLQKISNDEDEDELVMLETTMKRPSIIIADLAESIPSTEDTLVTVEAAPTPEHTTPVLEEINQVDTISATDLPAEEVNIQEHETDEVVPISEEVLPVMEQSAIHEDITLAFGEDTKAPIIEEPSSFPPKTSLAIVSRKQPNFIRRFFGKIWGS
ncbi:MAG TPA: hypothetical protein VFZ02_12355 [Ktedonobacteraceae bacterium]